MLDRDREETIERYRARYQQFGYDPKTLGWTKGRQHVRFAAVLELIGHDFKSILDIGCGFGDLFGYLKGIGWRGDYIGYDICPELLEEGRKRFGADGAQFECLDFSANPPQVLAQVAVSIGMFNHKLQGDNWDFVQSTLKAMRKTTSDAIVVDFLSATADKPHEHLFHVDAGRALNLGLSMSKRVALKHDYMPFEFCMAIWEDQSFSPEKPVFRSYWKHLTEGESST